VYHINAVDEVTQWEIVAAASQISELWLILVPSQNQNQKPKTKTERSLPLPAAFLQFRLILR